MSEVKLHKNTKSKKQRSKSRKHFYFLLFIFCLVAMVFAFFYYSEVFRPPFNYSYKIVNTYPHDSNAFTQGLVWENGFLYEGTGLEGHSSLRKVDLTSGKPQQQYNLPDRYFGEGIAIFNDTIVQLTYKSGVGFVYDKETFNLLRQFSYKTEGWGLTNNDKELIMSDGTDTLYFLNPKNFHTIGQLKVKDKGRPVRMINELEYVDDNIYANIWQTDTIIIISPLNGQVIGQIDLTGLLSKEQHQGADVLNGIAYDAQNKRLFVTGKFWPSLFEIKIIPQ
jgi:glutaminyl-peptide cyclotransferase